MCEVLACLRKSKMNYKQQLEFCCCCCRLGSDVVVVIDVAVAGNIRAK